MSQDFIPNGDTDFNSWIKIFATYFAANFAALGFTAAQNTALQNMWTSWQTDYPAHLTGQANASALAQKKDITRDNVEGLARNYSATMQANTSVTDDMKAALQITIPKTTKTPAPVPATRPMGNIDNRNRLQHTLHFFDESSPNSKAKPAGVRGCEIWEKIGGPPPNGPSDVTYLATDTRTPYLNHFDASAAGQTVHYMLRWVNTRNEPGPWSETISVTVSG